MPLPPKQKLSLPQKVSVVPDLLPASPKVAAR